MNGQPKRHRIEIVHESLLMKWPRLVRWQAQDVEGAQLRDELRQAAQLWDQHGRDDDYLWTGTAFHEYQLWREHYPGGLSALEEEFARAMTAAAGRRRRRIRLAFASTIVFLLAVVMVIGVYWRRSENAREEAEEQTRIARSERNRAEASKLLALAQLEVDDYPTAALAYLTRSIEIDDTREARLLAQRLLQDAPPARFLTPGNKSGAVITLSFSSNMEWLAVAGYGDVELWQKKGGMGRPVTTYPSTGFNATDVSFPDNDRLVTILTGQLRSFSIPSLEQLWSGRIPASGNSFLIPGREPLSTATFREGGWDVHEWSSSGEPRLLRRIEYRRVDSRGNRIIYARDDQTLVSGSLDGGDDSRILVAPPQEFGDFVLHPDGDRVAVLHGNGDVAVWKSSGSGAEPEVFYAGLGLGLRALCYDAKGHWLAAGGVLDGRPTVRLKDTRLPPEARPVTLHGRHYLFLNRLLFSPDGRWLVTSNGGIGAFWPLPETQSTILDGHNARVNSLAFSMDGRILYSASGGQNGTVRAWPVSPNAKVHRRILFSGDLAGFPHLDLNPEGDQLAVSGGQGTVIVIPTGGGEPRVLSGFSSSSQVSSVSFDPSGTRIAAGVLIGPAADKGVRVWDLETGETRMMPLEESPGDGFSGGIDQLDFLPDGRLLILFVRGSDRSVPELVLLDPEDGSKAVLMRGDQTGDASFSLIGSERAVATLTVPEGGGLEGTGPQPWIVDLRNGRRTPLSSFGRDAHFAVASDSTGHLVATGALDGTVRVGRIDGGEPHLLLGHESLVRAVAISPDGRWIASAGDDMTVRLWPMPDLSERPFHALPHRELLAKLRALTNLRVDDDESSATGYKLDYEPFPGWAEVPQW